MEKVNLSFIVIFLISLSVSLNATHIIEVTECQIMPGEANGIYERGPDIAGCACYDREDMGARIYYSFQPQFPSNDAYVFESGISCADGNPAPWSMLPCLQQSPDTECDGINRDGNIGCNRCVVTAFDDPDPIPTISEWGLIILGLCLTIFGFVGVKQRMFTTV